MGQKIVVGPVNKGLRTDILPFNIDNDSFPALINAYQWRGRVKRKRGTVFLGRLTRYFNSTSSSYTGTTLNPSFTITFDGGGNANLFGPYTNATPISFSLQSNGNIVPGSVSITGSSGPVTYTDPTQDGYLTPTGTSGPNTINYATGAILIPAQAGQTATVSFIYYPDLFVMGLRDLVLLANQFPNTLGFDTTYSYSISSSIPAIIYDVSFYKNPITGSYTSYVQKTNVTPTSWNGQDYQQFWTVNYQGALWATNGITNPFTTANIGMQFKPIVTVTVTSGGPPAIASLNIVAHGLSVGDFLFINEVITTTGINFQTGYVITVTDANNVVVEFPNATIATNGTGGIAQYLTNRSNPAKDCIRWYDGDPTNGTNSNPPVLTGHLGWVNFCPPLSQSNASIADLPAAQYYLVGCKMIVPFKDRLLFIGPVVQTSTGAPIHLQDTVIYSQNGTPYYTASFTGPVASSATIFNPILVPINQTSTADAYFTDVTGFGGFITAGFAQPILTASPNEDVLILGFSNRQTRFVYTGNDIIPFNFFVINSEYGSGSTFSSVTLDRGVLTIGDKGIVMTAQISCQRIDLETIDQVFQFNLLNNGSDRITAQRDFISEWIYFTYLDNENPNPFPNQTLIYNYRDTSWGIFNENYTTYGPYRQSSGLTWLTVPYPWDSWNEPWNAGASTLLQRQVIAGNQQGFVMIRHDEETTEGTSIYIQSFGANSTITSPDHGLIAGDYIIVSGCIGAIGSAVNNKIFQVLSRTQNTFTVGPAFTNASYSGGGLITRMYIPTIQTKQFPLAWDMGRKTRIGVQRYLLTATDNAQVELQIYLSENSVGQNVPAYNSGPYYPSPNSVNDSLVYTDILFTCPESTNLGLTPANINLQMVTADQQQQIWHRINTSLIGDTVQLGFTLSPTQMTTVDVNGNPISQFAEIELHGFIIDVTPSMELA